MIITIDTSKEFTQKRYAELKNVSLQVVKNWVNRKKVSTRTIKELNNMTLIIDDNILSE